MKDKFKEMKLKNSQKWQELNILKDQQNKEFKLINLSMRLLEKLEKKGQNHKNHQIPQKK